MKTDFSKKLYFLLSKNKLTQEEFAKKINSRQQVVSRWLSGTQPSATSIAKIAEALNTTPEELLAKENYKLNDIEEIKKEIEVIKNRLTNLEKNK